MKEENKRRKKKSTSNDIAELAKVSQTTVSMILNGKNLSSFSDDTIQKVMNIAESLGYKGGQKKAPAQKEGIVQIICPVLSNPYYSTLVQAVEQAAHKHGFRTIVCTTYRSEDIEKRHLSKINTKEIVGIVFTNIPLHIQRAEEINREIPVVIIGDRDGFIGVDMVEINSYQMGVAVANHLLELGHRNILFISTSLSKSNICRVKRMEGIQDTLNASGHKCQFKVKVKDVTSSMDLSDCNIEHRVGYSLMEECLNDTEFTAVVGVNDMVAYGAVDSILKAGYRIPDDYSVCGFDNIFISAMQQVTLSSVENYMTQKGHNAFEMLIESINQRRKDAPKCWNSFARVEYQPQLVIRSSTGAVRNKE